MAAATGARVGGAGFAAGVAGGPPGGLVCEGRVLGDGFPVRAAPREALGPTLCACADVPGRPEPGESADRFSGCAELQACVKAITMMAVAHFRVGRS